MALDGKKMGRRSNADEGPVHSPMDRRHAKKRKREPNKKHNRTNKKQNKQTAANKNQNKRNVACDRGPLCSTLQKIRFSIN